MLQAKEIGKRRNSMEAKIGRIFVSPKGREYSYSKGSRGIVVIEYLGVRMQVKVSDYKNTPIDSLLDVMQSYGTHCSDHYLSKFSKRYSNNSLKLRL